MSNFNTKNSLIKIRLHKFNFHVIFSRTSSYISQNQILLLNIFFISTKLSSTLHQNPKKEVTEELHEGKLFSFLFASRHLFLAYIRVEMLNGCEKQEEFKFSHPLDKHIRLSLM